MAIKTTRYGVGDEINQPIVPPLEHGKTFSFPYKENITNHSDVLAISESVSYTHLTLPTKA